MEDRMNGTNARILHLLTMVTMYQWGLDSPGDHRPGSFEVGEQCEDPAEEHEYQQGSLETATAFSS